VGKTTGQRSKVYLPGEGVGKTAGQRSQEQGARRRANGERRRENGKLYLPVYGIV